MSSNREWLLNKMASYTTFEAAREFAVGCWMSHPDVWGKVITRSEWEAARNA